VLVEGISDRLIFESLLDNVCTRFSISLAIEVVEVGGKHNFEDYTIILKGLLTPVYTIADRDYLTEVGSDDVRALFTSNFQKEWSTLTERKKSTDRKAMLDYLDAAIRSGDTVELRKFWDYFRNRLRGLKDSLRETEAALLESDIRRLSEANIFVLRQGEIEEYLPAGARDVRGIVDLVSERKWVSRLSVDHRVELGGIICSIIELTAESRVVFLNELKLAN
jgi:putative ATP-dependent endonuclease of OLD family